MVDCQNELDPEQNPPNPEEEMAMKDEDVDDEDELVREWRPEDGLQEGEVLDFDPSVYVTMHQLNLEVSLGSWRTFEGFLFCFYFILILFFPVAMSILRLHPRSSMWHSLICD